jgi:hypothetical protein
VKEEDEEADSEDVVCTDRQEEEDRAGDAGESSEEAENYPVGQPLLAFFRVVAGEGLRRDESTLKVMYTG